MPTLEELRQQRREMDAKQKALDKQIAEAIAFADAQPFAPEESAVVDVYSDIVAEVRER